MNDPHTLKINLASAFLQNEIIACRQRKLSPINCLVCLQPSKEASEAMGRSLNLDQEWEAFALNYNSHQLKQASQGWPGTRVVFQQ